MGLLLRWQFDFILGFSYFAMVLGVVIFVPRLSFTFGFFSIEFWIQLLDQFPVNQGLGSLGSDTSFRLYMFASSITFILLFFVFCYNIFDSAGLLC